MSTLPSPSQLSATSVTASSRVSLGLSSLLLDVLAL
jgi:hypothetical protein